MNELVSACFSEPVGLRVTDARKLFGMNLKRLLARPGFTKSALASYLDVEPPMVSRWLRGETLPIQYIDLIAEYLHVPLASLFWDETLSESAPDSRPITPVEAVRLINALGGPITLSLRRKKRRSKKTPPS